MAEVTVKVPKEIKDLIADTSETIYIEALKEVARKKISSTQKRLKELRKKIAIYETKYGKSYEEFSKKVPKTVKGHDDWIEWSYLVKITTELANKIEKLRLLIGK
ncbi:MAG: hypothetical protein HUU08_10675 [Candidatus Brocadia sp.]|nr:hypothetical protein [Candidatus Brocadia sp.]